MAEKLQLFFSQEKNISKLIFAVLLMTAFAFIFGPSLHAQFIRMTGPEGWGGGYGYGYGYGFGSDYGVNSRRLSGPPPWVYAWGYGVGYRSNVDSDDIDSDDLPNVVQDVFNVTSGDINNANQLRAITDINITTPGGGGITIPQGTTITPQSGPVGLSQMDAGDVSSQATNFAASLGGNTTVLGATSFGFSNNPLFFSQPVEIRIPVPGVADGTVITIRRSSDGGVNWTSNGLTSATTDTCSNGVGSNPFNMCDVTNGVCTIYTCSSSYFASYSSQGGGGLSSGEVVNNVPGSSNVSINNGEAETPSSQVTLSLSATNMSGSYAPLEMMVSNYSSFSAGTWEAYSTSKVWTLLPPGDGIRSVYVKFRNSQGTSSVAADSIEVVTPAEKIVIDEDRVGQIEQIISESSSIVTADIIQVLASVGAMRDLPREQAAMTTYVNPLTSGMLGVTEQDKFSYTNYIAYGTMSTLGLGQGERAGTLYSYKKAYNRLPSTAAEWSDLLKIANGRFPTARNIMAETYSLAKFNSIYLRKPNFKNEHDNAAINVMAYGIRPPVRNLDSEKVSIRIFTAIFGHTPSTVDDWDTVRGIAYSGATR